MARNERSCSCYFAAGDSVVLTGPHLLPTGGINMSAIAQRLRAHSIPSDSTAYNVMVSFCQPPR